MRLVGIILLGVVLLTSCEKVADQINELLPEKMTATIDGEKWTSFTRKTNLKEGKFIVSGISTTGETIILTIKGTATGTYSILSAPVGLIAVFNNTELTDIENPDLTNAYLGVTGTVNLTEVNTSEKTISGTFSFTATKVSETVSIENGSFENLKYTE